MCAGAAIGELGRLCLVAEAMRWTEAALIPARISTQRLWHPIGQSQPLAALNIPLGHSTIIANALGIDSIVILADCQIKRTLNAGAVHINLHLDEVHRLGFLNAILDHIVKRLLRVRLKLSDVALLWRLRHARLNDAIKASRNMASKADALLIVCTSMANIDPNGAKV